MVGFVAVTITASTGAAAAAAGGYCGYRERVTINFSNKNDDDDYGDNVETPRQKATGNRLEYKSAR